MDHRIANYRRRGIGGLLLATALACMAGCRESAPVGIAPISSSLADVNIANHPDALWVWMDAGPCLQACPLYWLRIYADGRVHYKGLAVNGDQVEYTRRMNVEDIAALDRAIHQSGYFGLDENCCNSEDRSDEPTVTMDIAAHGHRRRIEHYLGDQTVPAELKMLEKAITRFSGADRWIVVPNLTNE
jgi:hypothetical protein